MRQLFLIRHGQYQRPRNVADGPWHSLNDLLVATNGPLTAEGSLQAERTAQRLGRFPIDRIVTSSLTRCRETARIIAATLQLAQPEETDLLWESLPTMPASPEREIRFLSEEELAASRDRADRAYRTFFENETKFSGASVIVTHGNLIRYFVTRALGLEMHKWQFLDTMNCSITEFKLGPEGVRLVSLNVSGHLPVDLQTYERVPA